MTNELGVSPAYRLSFADEPNFRLAVTNLHEAMQELESQTQPSNTKFVLEGSCSLLPQCVLSWQVISILNFSLTSVCVLIERDYFIALETMYKKV